MAWELAATATNAPPKAIPSSRNRCALQTSRDSPSADDGNGPVASLWHRRLTPCLDQLQRPIPLLLGGQREVDPSARCAVDRVGKLHLQPHQLAAVGSQPGWLDG